MFGTNNNASANNSTIANASVPTQMVAGGGASDAGAFPVPRSREASFLPSSAPVSSLLPPIPPNDLRAQLQALLQQQQQPSQQQFQQQQLLQAAAAGTNPLLQQAAGSAAVVGGASTANIQQWSVEQLERHAQLLTQLKQPIPQNVAMLLQEARKRADKRQAKRVANRKSACTSRARKKALVQEMTELNARLRRQALILSLLPDLVVVMDVTGTITFCSAQVERVLKYNIDDLIGRKLTDIIVPGSKDGMQTLICELLKQTKTKASKSRSSRDGKQSSSRKVEAKEEKRESDSIEKESFPPSVVNVAPDPTVQQQQQQASSDDNSNGSNSKQASSLTNSSAGGNSGSDDGAAAKDKKLAKSKSSQEGAGGNSDSSSHSSNEEKNNLLDANANLERNVRWHNKKLKDKAFKAQVRAGYKDDVLGSAVTANNASARLSSLQHMSGALSEDDSGYRESNDSREETSSEGENSSDEKRPGKPVAPTCNVCLIRTDMTTIWCEVTSSIRTKDTEDEAESAAKKEGKKNDAASVNDDKKSVASASTNVHSRKKPLDGEEQPMEILLCLRPIRDGEGKADEAHRFKPQEKRVVSEDGTTNATASGSDATTSQSALTNSRKGGVESLQRPLKKRIRRDSDAVAVESLVSLSKQKTNPSV